MIGILLNERYRLDAELGRGGMGVVYRAHDTLLDRDVAVKVLSASGLGIEGRARLLREAQAAAGLNHPNIVSVHDAGEARIPDRVEPAGPAGPMPFVVMALVEGRSLHDRRPGSLEETVAVARQVCAALEHAHARGIVHRDLKPENVLLTLDPQEGIHPLAGTGPPAGAGRPAETMATAKLSDFGLARSIASRVTGEGTVAGTVFYLAPELALGQAYDGRADLYALGVMLYESATGRLPFMADDPVAVISQHLHAPPVSPRARDGAIPPALDALILRLLSKDPQDRPASATEVLRSLEAADILDQEATPARELSVLGLLPSLQYEESLAAFGQAIELAESAGLLAQAARAHNILGARLIDTQASRKHFLRAAELARQRGEILGELSYARSAALCSLVLGDLAAVEEVLASQRQLLDAADKPGTAALDLRWLEFMLLRYQGELAQAIEGLQSLRPKVREAGDLHGLAWLNENLAEACIWEGVGQEEEIEAMLREALDLGYMGTAVPAKSLQSVQRARQGEPGAARHLLSEAREQAAEQGDLVRWEPNLSWAEANLAMAEGRWAEALAAFEATVDTLGRTNLRWHRARTLIDWAGAHLARGESGDREADAEFEAMGAHGYVEWVKGRLEELGAGSSTV